MKKILLFIGLSISLSCSNGQKPPESLIDKDRMVLILKDIHLAEQQVSNYHLRSQDSSMVVFQALENKILKKYEADTGSYRSSYRYYVTQANDFKEIYQGVLDSLTAADQRLKQRKGTPTRTNPNQPPNKL
ncbi:MAG: DUF4296 domain-containing protein [Siphonobacter sp.]